MPRLWVTRKGLSDSIENGSDNLGKGDKGSNNFEFDYVFMHAG